MQMMKVSNDSSDNYIMIISSIISTICFIALMFVVVAPLGLILKTTLYVWLLTCMILISIRWVSIQLEKYDGNKNSKRSIRLS